MASRRREVIISYRGQSVLVEGATFPIKDVLKNLGGWWDSAAKGWVFRKPGSRDSVVSILGTINGINIIDLTAGSVDRTLGSATSSRRLEVTISYEGQSVLVEGDTYPIKEVLKDLGGRWDSDEEGWVFWKPGSRDSVILTLGAINGINIIDQTAGCSAPSSQRREVIMSYRGEAVLVQGDTFPIKDDLKDLGGWWDSTAKGWVFQKPGSRDSVVSRLGALNDINIIDRTTGSPARGGGASANADDYSDLTSLPTPNKGKFGDGAVPGEYVRTRLPEQVRQMYIQLEGGHFFNITPNGNFYVVASRQQKVEKQQEEEEADCDLPAGAYMPKLSVEASRTKQCINTNNFVCDGTMYRHTVMSWEDAPIEFKGPHNVEASSEAPVESIRHEDKIEDLTPSDCQVYWKTVWEKCRLCHEADRAFECWAMRASTSGAKEATKKRKADEAALAGDVDREGDAKKPAAVTPTKRDKRSMRTSTTEAKEAGDDVLAGGVDGQGWGKKAAAVTPTKRDRH